MNLKEITKQKITNHVLKQSSKEEWRILIYNEHTAKLLTNTFTVSEILSHDIIAIKRLEDPNREPVQAYPALYFIELSDDAVQRISKDAKNRMYSGYQVVATNSVSPRHESKLMKLGCLCKSVDINFVPVEQRVFVANSAPQGLLSLANNIEAHFKVYHTSESTLPAAKEIDALLDTEKRRRHGHLIVLSRSNDLFTPLIHFFTFQAYLHDIRLIAENVYNKLYLEEGVKLWKSIKHTHIAEINTILSAKAKALATDLKDLEKKKDVRSLTEAVSKAPQNIKMKEEVSMFIDLLDQALTALESDSHKAVSDVEQNVCTGYDTAQNRYSRAAEDFFRILKNEEIRKEDKLRLYLLVLAAGYTFQDNEESLVKAVLGKKEVMLKQRMEKMRREFNFKKERVTGFKYENSRFVPLLKGLIDNFIKKKDGSVRAVREEAEEDVSSIRKSSFVFRKSEGRKGRSCLCIYIIGGVTYAEMEIVYAMSKEMGVEIVIGSECILTPSAFVEQLKGTQ